MIGFSYNFLKKTRDKSTNTPLKTYLNNVLHNLRNNVFNLVKKWKRLSAIQSTPKKGAKESHGPGSASYQYLLTPYRYEEIIHLGFTKCP